MKRAALLVAITLPIVLFFVVPGYSRVVVGASEVSVAVDIADEPRERSQGLSDRPALGVYHGMLFEFQNELIPSFWMKDMNFPLDIIWIDADGVVVGFEEDVDPSTFPDTFSPESQITHVLELNAGSVAEWGIQVGQKIAL